MYKKSFVSVACLFVTLLFANSSFALAEFTFHGLTVGDFSEWDARGDMTDTFERYDYESIGYSYEIKQTKYNLIEDGEIWYFHFINLATGEYEFESEKLKALTSSIDDDMVCLFPVYGETIDRQDPNRICFSKSLPSGAWERVTFSRNMRITCQDPGAYKVETETFQEITPYDFQISDFIGLSPVVLSQPKNLTPMLPARTYAQGRLPAVQATSFTMEFEVKDNIGCNKPVQGKEIELLVTIVPESGSHLENTDPTKAGTGKFTGASPEGDTGEAHVTLITGSDGKASATYTAGVYGLKERLQVSSTDGNNVPVVSSKEFDIKVNGLIALTGFPLLGNFYTSDCDKNHNTGESTGRLSTYVTSSTANKIGMLNFYYETFTGDSLCFNDASLAFGGYFDDGNDGSCHASHRRGIDIDVNTVGSCVTDMNQEVNYRGRPTKKRDVLIDIGTTIMNSWKSPYENMHFRYAK